MANDQFDVYSSASWKKLFDYYNKKYFKSKLDNNTVVIAAELAPKDLRKGRKTLNFGLLVRSNKLKTEDLCFIHPPIIGGCMKQRSSVFSLLLLTNKPKFKVLRPLRKSLGANSAAITTVLLSSFDLKYFLL